jgi:hypothetical protein
LLCIKISNFISLAGKRPKQPTQEREYFENLWKSNFDNSNISYEDRGFDDSGGGGRGRNDTGGLSKKRTHSNENMEEIVFKGKGGYHSYFISSHVHLNPSHNHLMIISGPFSNSVSRAFIDHNFHAITLQMPRFKITKSKADNEIFASFLVVVAIGSVTFGIWKRHSDFLKLARGLTGASLSRFYCFYFPNIHYLLFHI